MRGEGSRRAPRDACGKCWVPRSGVRNGGVPPPSLIPDPERSSSNIQGSRAGAARESRGEHGGVGVETWIPSDEEGLACGSDSRRHSLPPPQERKDAAFQAAARIRT